MRYAYPVVLDPEPEGGFSVSFPDVPEALTQGETEAEALSRAEDALVTALSFYTDEGEALPRPSAAKGRPMVVVPVMAAAKLALHDAMLADGMSNVELGRRMEMDEKAVRRMRDPLTRTHIGTLEAALRTLGRRVELIVEAA